MDHLILLSQVDDKALYFQDMGTMLPSGEISLMFELHGKAHHDLLAPFSGRNISFVLDCKP